MAWDFILILLFLGIIVPWRSAGRVRKLLALPHLFMQDRLTVYASTIALQWLVTAIVIWRWLAHGGTGAHLGLTVPDPVLALVVGAVLVALVCALQITSLRSLARLPRDQQGILGQLARKFMPQNSIESLAYVALVVTVALCEEIIYRGFVLAVIADAAGDLPIAGILGSAALFGLAHIYQGRRGVIVTFTIGLVFAYVRVWTDSLAPTIVAHLVTDLLVGLWAPRLLAAAGNSPVSAPSPDSPPSGSALVIF